MASAQTLYASQDASIKEGVENLNGNWSNVEAYGGNTAIVALVEFDISNLSNSSISAATFRPFINTLKNNASSTFSIYSTTPKDWDENSVEWGSRPPRDQLLDTITITGTGSYVDFDVTSAIQLALQAGQSKVTLWIEDSEGEYEQIKFDSSTKTNKPQLVVKSGADSTAPTFSSAATSTDGTKVVLSYNENLSSTTASASDFAVEVDGSVVSISSVATSGSTVELTLSSTVRNNQTVTVAYADPTSDNDSNAVQDDTGNDAVNLNTTAVTNNSTVSSKTTTTLFASQDASIKENNSTNGDWSKNEVYGGSTPVIALVEFDLSSFSKGESIQSATFRPYVRTLKNNQSSSFSIYSTTAKDWSQSSVKWSTRPPKDQLLDTITITKSGSYVDFEVTNAIQDAINNGQSKVTLWIEDSEKAYEGFEFDSVNKNASYPNEPELVINSGVAEPDTTAPTFFSAATSTDGSKVILTYNEALSATTAAPSDFSVKVDGSAETISSVTTSGSTVELTLSSAVKNGQTVTVAYTDPTANNDNNAIQDSAGNDATSLTSSTVSNTVSPPDATAPSFSSAATSTDGSKVILTYNETLSSTTASASDFTIDVDGSAATISSVATSGTTVELTLSSAIKNGQTVTVAYTDPTSGNDNNAVQDVAGNDTSNLNTSAVTNNVPQTSTNNFVQLLGSNNQSTNNDQFDGCLYAEIGNIKDLDTSKAVEYQWYANGVLMPGYTDVAIRGLRWSDAYKNKSFHVDVTYTPIGSSETKTLSSDSMAWGNFYFNYGGEPGNGYQGTSNTDGIRDIIVMPDFQGNNPKALGSYLQYDSGISEPGNEADRHSIKTVHQDDVRVPAREGKHLIEFSAKEISNRTELGTGDTHHWFYEGEDIYFSYSLYLPKEEWDPVTKYSTIITQLRQFGMHDGPNFGLRLSNEGDYKLIVESMLFDDYPYVATLKPDQWHDIKIHSKQSKDNDGEVNIWIDNQLAWEYDGPTMYYSDDAGYISFGMYTEIRDDRKFYVDAIEQTDHLYRVNSLEEWSQLSPGGNPTAPDTTAPTFSSAATSTDGTKVILTYDEALSSTTATASDFTIEVDGSAATISGVATSGSTVELTLNSGVAYGQTVTVAYTDPTSGNDSNAIQDAAGNDASNLSPTTVTNQVRDTSRTNTGPRILGTAEDYSGVRGVLFADIYGVADLDQTKTTSYQWLANGNAIAEATNQTLDIGDFKSSIENKEISVQLTYTNTSGQETTVTSAVMPYEGFRIVANAEDGRNEWSGTTASEEVTGSVNPYPFVESYSKNGTSSTDGTSAGSAHNITAVKASDVGITAREGDNVIRIYADGSKSNRSELAHLNNETTFKAGEEYYFSGSFFAPKSEWDPVTEGGSTVITQLKQYGGGDPNFELRLSNNGDYKMFWRAVPHSLDDYQDMGSAIPDAWNDLKIYTKHSQGSDGVFRVWLNNEKVIDYSGATMYRSDDGYLKFGMYTEIHDERIIYWDAIDIADHLENDFDTWLSSGDNLPSLTVSGISDNQQFSSSDQLSISGHAIDPAGNRLGSSGGIQSVDLFLGDTKIQSTTDSNFSFSNLNLSNGEQKLRLVATDTDGNTAEKSYTIWIGNKPAEVAIEASDFFLGSFSTDSDVALTTTAADLDGSIVTVEFLANGQLIGTASEGNGNQYSLNWRPSQAGAYSIQARATDNQGAVTLSDSKAALVGTSITDSTLTATQDVTITQNSSTTGNYSNTEVYGSTSAPKIALVEFDLSNISSAKYIESTAFKPYVTKLQNAPGTFSIYAAGTENWSQTSADWYDKPTKGELLDTITISSTNQYVSFDVTEALQDAVDAGQTKITLWIEDSEQEQQRFDFASENNTSINKPAQLVVSSATEALPAPIQGSYVLSSTPDTTAPTFSSAATSTDGTKVILTYNETLSSTTASASDFAVEVDGSVVSISSVDTSGSNVELTLANTIKNDQTVNVVYADPSSDNDINAIQDSSGNDVASLSISPVSNNSTVAGTAPTFSSAATSTDGTKVVLTYNETLSSTTASASDFAVEVDGSAVSISSVATSGSNVELTLTNTVKNDQSVNVVYADPSSANDTNAIQDPSGNDVASLSITPVSNNSTVAGTAPTFSSAATSTDGTKVILTYNETLSSTTASASDFAVEVDGSVVSISSVATSGSNVELTLANTIKNDQSVNVVYADPSSANDTNAIQDPSGNDVASLSITPVSNYSTESSGPKPVQVSIPDRQVHVGQSIAIPISINDAEGIESLDLKLTYDPTLFSPTESSPLISAGSLNPGSSFVVNNNQPGQVLISWATAAPLASGSGSIATLNLQLNSDAAPGTSLVDLVSASINEGDIDTELQDGNLSLRPPSLQLESIRQLPHGLALQLSEAPDLEAFNLYDGPDSTVDAPDLQLTDSTGTAIALSAHWQESSQELLLLADQQLNTGDYNLSIDSRADGLISASTGERLDGDGDGTSGDAFSQTISFTAPEHVLSITNTSRGAGQSLSVNGRNSHDPLTGLPLPASKGLPIELSTASSLTSFSGQLNYDSSLLLHDQLQSALTAGAQLPDDWSIEIDSRSTPGNLIYSASGTTAISGSNQEILRFQGTVPTMAAPPARGTTGNGLYGSSTLINASISSEQLSGDTIAVDPGLVALAYSGDTTGNGSLSSLDASRVQRVVVGLDSGFDAYDSINPTLLGDTTGNGTLSSLDASRIQQQVVGLPVNSFPDPPAI